ncbi:hypothetical protein [Paenibacillus glycinis]|uniref:Thoeris protein ThsB TIR-like domain-containing protein n=1 Tax=Paenibacillus glycinis TaxID=2697035 RepID=A0ABW9XZE3_9BACL|nr:hypothetical protein [Paenibacillus glycinis]NBD27783.1 hypothetical protein [Paenibacillus glycinis]
MTNYYTSDKAHIYWDEAIESVVITWNSFAQGDEFREPLDKMIELAVMKKAKKALFDSSHILVLAEDTKWLAEEWLPRLLNAGIQYAATVNPVKHVTDGGKGKTPSRRNAKKWQHHEFEGVHHAVKWLSGITA